MIRQDTLLVTLVQLVDRLPAAGQAKKRGRGRPTVYSDCLFLKAVVIMIVRHLRTVHELLAVLQQPTAEMQTLRSLLCEDERFPSRRTWERRLNGLPASLPAQIGCLGRFLAELIDPWQTCGRAVAIDSTILRARGGQWHAIRTGNEESFRTVPSIKKRIGPSLAGTAGSTAGNCTWFLPWRQFGFLWRQS